MLSQADAAKRLAGTGTVALYEPAARQAAAPGSTRAVLDSLGVKYDLLPDFAQLGRYRVVLIGAEALDQTALAAGGALRAWVEQGGRVVCFEQSYEGELPFAPGYRLARRGNSAFADLIAVDHPAVAGFRAWHWELWNSLEPTPGPRGAGPLRAHLRRLCPAHERRRHRQRRRQRTLSRESLLWDDHGRREAGEGRHLLLAGQGHGPLCQ